MENKELDIFYTLMKNTEFKNISVEFGKYTNLVTKVTLEDSVLIVDYFNTSTEYEIFFKGVKIGRKKIKEEKQITSDINNIMKSLKENIIKEFLSISL